MSISKWRYTEECNGRPCPGDCDHCSFEPTDLISRADAIEAVQDHFNDNGFKGYNDGQKMMDRINALPSAELPKGELISRADAIEALRGLFDMRKSRAKVIVECFGELLNALPSADAIQRGE